MQKLANYLHRLHRLENSDGNLKIEKIELGGIISKVIKETDSYAKQNKIKIVKNIVKVNIKGSEEYVAEIVSILIENAIKYSGNAKKIEVSTKKNGLLSVRDFGIGIEGKDLPHIFDRFYRVDSSRSKVNVEGYGLGLSIAKSISERLGARIKVQSKVGKGSTFSVQFPLNVRTA
jgi:signal transduction histidine kinase